jgi:hypothetical protein
LRTLPIRSPNVIGPSQVTVASFYHLIGAFEQRKHAVHNREGIHSMKSQTSNGAGVWRDDQVVVVGIRSIGNAPAACCPRTAGG